jgi:hypothetical protein
MAVSLTVKPEIRLGRPQRLLALDDALGLAASGGYDVARDGRFLFPRPAATAESPRAFLVQNWTAAARR